MSIIYFSVKTYSEINRIGTNINDAAKEWERLTKEVILK